MLTNPSQYPIYVTPPFRTKAECVKAGEFFVSKVLKYDGQRFLCLPTIHGQIIWRLDDSTRID